MAYTNEDIEHVWNSARKVEGMDADMIRKDPCGAWIVREKYGMPENDYGWEIDLIFPKALGGDERPENLRAMHCANVKSKGSSYPSYIVATTARGQVNVSVRRVLKVNKTKRQVLEAIYHYKG